VGPGLKRADVSSGNNPRGRQRRCGERPAPW
jgi:hypothetical protein